MTFLVDNALSPALATLLNESGHDAVHVRDIALQHADDATILERAAADDRIVVSADMDFGGLLASANLGGPSVIQFRGEGSRRPDAVARVMLANLGQVSDALASGCIVTFEPNRVRIRALPISPQPMAD